MKFPAVFDVANLNGNNGFKITSLSKYFGGSVSGIGDINSDGQSDFIIGAQEDNKAYVIFGAKHFPDVLDTSHLNGNNGFVLISSSNTFGSSVAGTGDINGDDKPDLIVGAIFSNKAYVIFGASSFPIVLDTSSLNGKNGFTLTSSSGGFGSSVAGTGDINGDGKPDLIVGAYGAKKAYVIFGASDFPAVLDTSSLNGINGFVLTSSSLEFGGSASGIGDINSDGRSDLIIGADVDNQTYVVFGAKHFPAVLDTSSLNGANGFMLISSSKYFGQSVAGTGDINGDGRPDFIIGAWAASKAYAIFGASSFPAIFDTSNLNGANGFMLLSSSGALGISVSGAWDVNGDEKFDVIVGDCGNNKAYVVFGTDNFPAILDTSSLNGANGFTLTSSDTDFGRSVAGTEDINGDGNPDLIVGAAIGSSRAYVIFCQTMQQNYGMLSQIGYFVPMNSTETTGRINLGSTGFWCNSDSLFIGDFNGDGASDLLCSLHDGQTYVMLSQLTARGVIFTPMSSDPNGLIKIANNDKWCLKDNQEMRVGDFNGDGKTDLLCHNNQQFNQGSTYVMLSTGNGFKPMASSSDGYVPVGKLGSFCPIGGRLVIGNFDGLPGDDLLCSNPVTGNMIMIPNNTSFVSVNDDPLGVVTLGLGRTCSKVWCADSGSVLMSGEFNDDNKTDLICNFGGKNEIMLSTFNNISCAFQAINPASGNQQRDGWIPMGHEGKLPIWCDATKSKLIVADIDGNKLDDLICNTAGVNEIQLCRSAGNNQYEFISINAGDPGGSGRTKISNYDKWCNSQNLFTGDFNEADLNDLWCNQNYSPVGEIYDEQT